MKIIAISLLSLSCLICYPSLAGEHITINCKSSQADCPKLPPPPEPPAPPVISEACMPKPPAAVAPGQTPEQPVIPVECLNPPTPPAPPPIEMPAQIHKACTNQKEGTNITWNIDDKSHITGVCLKHEGKMLFSLHRAEMND